MYPSQHACKRYVERTKNAINTIEAEQLLKQSFKRSIQTSYQSSREYIKRFFDPIDKTILVVNINKNVIITVYKFQAISSLD